MAEVAKLTSCPAARNSLASGPSGKLDTGENSARDVGRMLPGNGFGEAGAG
jgi:hypothetical protein